KLGLGSNHGPSRPRAAVGRRIASASDARAFPLFLKPGPWADYTTTRPDPSNDLLARVRHHRSNTDDLGNIMVIQPPNFRSDNDVAVVTGGGSGIGAHGFASRGARVMVLDVDARRACKVAEEIGDCTCPLLVDVTNQGSIGGAIGLIAK